MKKILLTPFAIPLLFLFSVVMIAIYFLLLFKVIGLPLWAALAIALTVGHFLFPRFRFSLNRKRD